MSSLNKAEIAVAIVGMILIAGVLYLWWTPMPEQPAPAQEETILATLKTEIRNRLISGELGALLGVISQLQDNDIYIQTAAGGDGREVLVHTTSATVVRKIEPATVSVNDITPVPALEKVIPLSELAVGQSVMIYVDQDNTAALIDQMSFAQVEPPPLPPPTATKPTEMTEVVSSDGLSELMQKMLDLEAAGEVRFYRGTTTMISATVLAMEIYDASLDPVRQNKTFKINKNSLFSRIAMSPNRTSFHEQYIKSSEVLVGEFLNLRSDTSNIILKATIETIK